MGKQGRSHRPRRQRQLQWSFGGEATLRPDRLSEEAGLYDRLNSSLLYRYRFFEAVADFSLARDERYVPDEKYMLGRGFFLENGGLLLDFDFLTLSAGRFVHRDTVEGPYSVFISAADPRGGGWAHGLPAMQADLTIKGGRFTYESRWVRLNSNAIQLMLEGDPTSAYPDRGASYKVFSVELGDWRFGLQDAAVYFGREFDAEYFLSPIPHILTQMVTKRDSTPWQEDANDNSIMGLFAEWRPPRAYLYAQWLVDDISLNFLIPWFLRDTFGSPTVANKWAWSVGGHWDLAFGRLGFYHAGATKYTFAATEDDKPYGYTYYPAVEYSLDDDDDGLRGGAGPAGQLPGVQVRGEQPGLPPGALPPAAAPAGRGLQGGPGVRAFRQQVPGQPLARRTRPQRNPHVRRPGAGAHGDRGGQRGLALAGLDLLHPAAPGRGVQPPGAGAGGQMRRCRRSIAPRPGSMLSCTPGPWASPGARAGAGPGQRRRPGPLRGPAPRLLRRPPMSPLRRRMPRSVAPASPRFPGAKLQAAAKYGITEKSRARPGQAEVGS